MFHLKQEKEEQRRSKVSQKKEKRKIWAEINEMKNKHSKIILIKPKAGSLKDKIDKSLAGLIKKKTDNTNHSIKNEKKVSATDSTHI